MKKVDLVIPVYNEGRSLESNLQLIEQTLTAVPGVEFSIIIVDDGSTDPATIACLESYGQGREHSQILSLTRNFGKEPAIQAGLEHSDADAVIVMDSDLQHPPALIPKMVGIWRQGVDVVEACKISRGKESAGKRLLTRGFYRIFELLADRELSGHSDFKLLDRKVVQAYLQLPERKRFFRGLIPWMGFAAAQVYFEVPQRTQGQSGWSWIKLLRLSVDALTGFSSAPLYLINILGLVCLALSLGIGGMALYYKFCGLAVSGFTTVILLILLIGSFIMFGLGLLGMYIGQIFTEVKGRPLYVLDKKKCKPRKGQKSEED